MNAAKAGFLSRPAPATYRNRRPYLTVLLLSVPALGCVRNELDEQTQTAQSAVGTTPVLTDIWGDPGGQIAEIFGKADPGAQVEIFATSACDGPSVATVTAGASGSFMATIAAPPQATRYSASATLPSGTTDCSDPRVYRTYHRECPLIPDNHPITRQPEFYWNTGSYSYSWHATPSQYSGYLSRLLQSPPLVQLQVGSSAMAVFNLSVAGVAEGSPDPIYGGGATDGGFAITRPPLSVEKSQIREEKLQTFLADYEGVTLTGTYTDFMAAIYGNHTTGTGMWQFHSQWSDYQAAFDIGPAPPSPTDWLRRYWDPTVMEPQTPALPSYMAGFSFEYNASHFAPEYRYTANILSPGWEQYAAVVAKYLAKVGYEVTFLDNVWFRKCWNTECESGYDAWADVHYSQAEIDRYLTYPTSRFFNENASFDRWYLYNGVLIPEGTTPNGGTVVRDIDAVHGAYSAKLRGGLVEGAASVANPQGVNWKYVVRYKTDCPAARTYNDVKYSDGTGQAHEHFFVPSSTWSTHEAPFFVPATAGPNATAAIGFYTNDPSGVCTLWIDDLQLVADLEQPGHEVRLARGIHQELGGKNFASAATYKFWDSAVDSQLEVFRDGGRTENPNYDLFPSSGRQRRASGYFLIEGQGHEAEGAMPDVGIAPGTYLPSCLGTACTPMPCGQDIPYGENCDPVPTETSCRRSNCVSITQPMVATNVFDFRLTHDLRLNEEFSYMMHLPDRREKIYRHTPSTTILSSAEVAAFSGGGATDLRNELEYYYYCGYHDGTELTQIRQARDDFFAWTSDHPELYRCLESVAPVGYVFHDLRDDNLNASAKHIIQTANAAAAAGVPYHVVTEQHLTYGDFSKYKVLVYHDVERMSAAEVEAVKGYLSDGGTVILSGDRNGKYDEYFREWEVHPAPAEWPPVSLVSGTTYYPYGSGVLIWLPGGVTTADVQAALSGYNATPSLSTAQLTRFRTAVWEGPMRQVVHLVNYDVPLGHDSSCHTDDPEGSVLQNVDVKVHAPLGFVPSVATLLSPGNVTTMTLPVVNLPDGTYQVTVPQTHIYSVLLVE